METPIQNPVQQAVVKSENPADRVGDIKTIYGVSGATIIWRNFLAGFSRALGGIVVYMLFLGFLGAFAVNVLLPKIKPILDTYQQALTSINNLSAPKDQSQPTPLQVDPEVLQNLVDQIKQ